MDCVTCTEKRQAVEVWLHRCYLLPKRGQSELSPSPLRPHASDSQELPARSEKFRSLAAAGGWFTAAGGKWPDWPWNLRSPRAGSSGGRCPAERGTTLEALATAAATRSTLDW